MFSYVEETEEGTVLYQVRTYRWCMCWAFFNASEVFELTGIPYLYRKFLGIPRKPTFLECLLNTGVFGLVKLFIREVPVFHGLVL